jgi:chromosome segregation ATPase
VSENTGEVKILGRASLAQAMSELLNKLDSLHRKIVDREAATDAVDVVRKDCNKYYRSLEEYRQELLDSEINVDRVLAATISNLNSKLRSVREALGQLVETMRRRDTSPSSRRAPSDFERKHGAVESVIEAIIPEIRSIVRDFGGTSGLQEHSRRRHGNNGRPGDASNGGEYDRRRYHDRGPREYRRMIS